MNTTQIGCTPEIISNRIVDHDRLQADYNLEVRLGDKVISGNGNRITGICECILMNREKS